MSTLQTTTSTTRPSAQAGDTYFETDTKNIIVYDGTNWRGYANDGVSYALSQGLSLDGNGDYGVVSNDSALAITGDLSIALWLYLDTNQFGPLVSKRTPGVDSNYNFSYLGGGNGNKLAMYDGSTTSNGPAISIGSWVHVAVVVDSGTSTTFYVNGSSSAGSAAQNIVADSNDIYFGKIDTLSLYVDGKMDDIAIYNRQLTGTEVNNIKDGIFPTNGLAGLWTFEGDTGSSFTDKSGNGNDGTLSGDASLVSVTSHS
jgi:hypothetical protein